MSGYTPLFSSIVASTIWRESKETKILWITMLAMADSRGIVEGSIPGMADMARITIEECKAALVVLLSPDEYSRSKNDEGRRLREVEGGWLIINHADFKEKSRKRAAYMQEYRAKRNHDVTTCNHSVTPVTDCNRSLPPVTDTDANTDANTDKETRDGKPSAILIYPKSWDGSPEPLKAWNEWLSYRKPLGVAKNCPLLWQKQLDWLSSYSAQEAVTIINASIRNGWRGLFEPKSIHGQPPPPAKTDKNARIKADNAFVRAQNVQDAVKKLDHGKDDISRTLKVLNDAYRDCGVNAKGQTVATEAYEYWKLGEELKRNDKCEPALKG